MSALKYKLAFLEPESAAFKRFAEFEPLQILTIDLKQTKFNIEILIVNAKTLQNPEVIETLQNKKKNLEIQKLVLCVDVAFSSSVPILLFNLLKPDAVVEQQDLNSELLHDLWQKLSQSTQDESYLSLSTELNTQYEILKQELEQKLVEKTKNLIDSRKHIYEINNRFEFLRKTLYVTSVVKNVEQAEGELNKLLTQQNKITWLKIVRDIDIQKFENDLGEDFESTLYKQNFNIDHKPFWIVFIKGDKRVFKKTDIDYFKKLIDTLQINLNRYANILSLQQNERLFDLAFHSSPHYILVIDKNYQVKQVNLALEKIMQENSKKTKCYELLFNRKDPCVGCKLGEKFQIQYDRQTFRVQSNHFQQNIDDDEVYWIHLYENISEQIAIENKFQQSTRLAELGLISSSIAHELNNPLGGIISYLQIMKAELQPQHPFQSDILLMYETALRMKKIIEDLLLFSRKEGELQLENHSLNEVIQKNIDSMQMQLKKENLKVLISESNLTVAHAISLLHFRNSTHLVFQFFLQRLKIKKLSQPNITGLVEVKIFQDQMASYLNLEANLGPYDAQANSNDMTLISLEKSLFDQGYQVVIAETKPNWIQVLVTLPKRNLN